MRAHVEYADTACNFAGTPQYGCAYESSIYTTGIATVAIRWVTRLIRMGIPRHWRYACRP